MQPGQVGAKGEFLWQTATYSDWNRRLLTYFLGPHRTRQVEKIAATPEELAAVAGDSNADPHEVTRAFIAVIRAELPTGVSFCGFCLGHRSWTPQSEDPPHFFGMLWFTCLLAAGYPEHAGGAFNERFRNLIGTADNLRYGNPQRDCVNRLWEELAEWTRGSDAFAELVLPPKDDHLVVIGRSYFLAFPNRRDRQALADVLSQAGLAGLEPPIVPVVRALVNQRQEFSKDFCEALDNFRAQFISHGRDPRESAFWRAVRGAALTSHDHLDLDPDSCQLTVLASWDDDGTLLFRLAGHNDAPCPAEFSLEELPLEIDGLTHFLADDHGNPTTAVGLALESEIELPLGLRALIGQGILIFQENLAGEYTLASGVGINGADLALVRNESAESFTAAFGGHVDESRFDGWSEVDGCRVQQLSDTPTGLRRATQLLHTTGVPQPRLAGGVRVGRGFLWFPGLEPVVRAPGAVQVLASCAGHEVACERSSEDPNEWVLPESLVEAAPADVEISARWEVTLGGSRFLREGTRTLHYEAATHGCTYRSPSAGRYWRESCAPAQRDHHGRRPVPLDLTAEQPEDSSDLLHADPTARYLGPGLGEISVGADERYPWLAVGTQKNPSHLAYLGDLDDPLLPDGGESAVKGDRRAWSRAFTSQATIVSARISGNDYRPMHQEPRLQRVYLEYRRRARRQVDFEPLRHCPPSDFGACIPRDFRDEGLELTAQVVEALAALGLRRSGIPLKEVQGLFHRLTGSRDYLLWQQLIRAWTESGQIDLLRRQTQSQTLVVPRVPMFVMVRRAAAVHATLVGLAPRLVLDTLRVVAARNRIDVQNIRPANPFQAPVPRLLDCSPEEVGTISTEIGLPPPMWLAWRDFDALPAHLGIGQGRDALPEGDAPDAYKTNAWWDWERMAFRNISFGPPPAGDVVVERRWHARRCSIYVVSKPGVRSTWCYLRSWALLRASELRDDPAFWLAPAGDVESQGSSPMHLPLPIARLCTVLGAGIPGPNLDAEGRVCGYRYPFGPYVGRLIDSVLPDTWIAARGQEA